MSRNLSHALFCAFALCASSASCYSPSESVTIPPSSSSGGAFTGGGGKGGFISAGGTSVGFGGTTGSRCSPSGGPVDVGHIGGPGRDATSTLWTLPFPTGSAPHLAIDPQGNLIVSMKFSTISIGGTFYTAYDGSDTLLAKFDAHGNVFWSKVLLAQLPSLTSLYSVHALATDAEGNIFVAGSFSGAVSFGGENLSSTIGPGGVFNDAFLIKLDPLGQHVFSKKFGDANEQTVTALAVDASGNVTVGGNFGGIINLGGDDLISTRGSFGLDVFVARFDAAGEHLQSAAFGSERDEQITGLDVDSSGNAVVFGHDGTLDDLQQFFGDGLFVRKFDSALSSLYEVQYPSNGVAAGGLAVDSEQNAVLVASLGNATEFQAGAPTPLGLAVAKLDAMGNTLWHKSFDDLDAYATTVDIDAEGNVALSGGFKAIDFGGGPLSSAGATDVFVAKLDPAGDHLWSQRGGSCDADAAAGLRLGSDGSVFVVGTFIDTIAFNTNSVSVDDLGVFLAHFAP